MEASDVYGDRSHRFAPPASVMFDALTVDLDKWLDLAPGEVRPSVPRPSGQAASYGPRFGR